MENFQYTLPEVIDPPRGCVTIEIPLDFYHQVAFWRALFTLCFWFNWQRDDDKRGKDAAAVWYDIYQKARTVYEGQGFICAMFDIRLKPGSDCIIQETQDGGSTWVDAIDMSLCATETANSVFDARFPPTNTPDRGQPGEQPGGGNPQPNECFDLDLSVAGNQMVLIPLAIGSAWTVTISQPQGAWGDSANLTAWWACYDGHQFIAGICTGGTETSGTDPSPSDNHMALLLAMPGGAYHALTNNTPYVIPDGLPTGNYYLLANDTLIGDNQGGITLHLQACNTAVWEHEFDWSTGKHGWRPVLRSGDVDNAVYVDGLGWVPNSSFSDSECRISIDVLLTGTVTSATLYYDATVAPNSGQLLFDDFGFGASDQIVLHPETTGTHIVANGSGSVINSHFRIDCTCGAASAIILRKLVLIGTGTDPF